MPKATSPAAGAGSPRLRALTSGRPVPARSKPSAGMMRTATEDLASILGVQAPRERKPPVPKEARRKPRKKRPAVPETTDADTDASVKESATVTATAPMADEPDDESLPLHAHAPPTELPTPSPAEAPDATQVRHWVSIVRARFTTASAFDSSALIFPGFSNDMLGSSRQKIGLL